MMICKWAGDPADEYCKSCNGCTMMVEGLEKSCEECAGYEAGSEEVKNVINEDTMNPPVDNNITQEEPKNSKKDKQVTTNTSKPEKSKKEVKNDTTSSLSVKEDKAPVVKVKEEKHTEEEVVPGGIRVKSLRYASSATVKKGDNYYKFSAEEEWDLELYDGDIQDARDQLWAKLNGEVDSQIEDLNNM